MSIKLVGRHAAHDPRCPCTTRAPAVAQAAPGSLADMLLTGPVAAAVVAELGRLSPPGCGALNSLRASCKVRCRLSAR